jgi:hypothetical protein
MFAHGFWEKIHTASEQWFIDWVSRVDDTHPKIYSWFHKKVDVFFLTFILIIDNIHVVFFASHRKAPFLRVFYTVDAVSTMVW